MKTAIEMAREVGFMLVHEGGREIGDWYECFTDEIERLVEIARADAIADEREACAKVCEEQDGAGMAYENWWEFSAAIRARGNT